MESLKTIPPEIAALIPKAQLRFTNENLQEYSDAIKQLVMLLEKCPQIGETDGMKEHPLIFHYFTGSTDFYICEYDRNNTMFGYAILGGDLQNAEWGYINLSEITDIVPLNIEYFSNEEKSIEAALYTAYPNHYKKPKSLTA